MSPLASADAATAPLADTPRPTRWGLRLLVLALAQTAALGWIVWDRVALLRAPTEIRMTPQPVDPRDLFRGDYVVLRYGISSPPRELVDDRNIRRGDRLWVTIAPPLDPAMTPPPAAPSPPRDAETAPVTAPVDGEIDSDGPGDNPDIPNDWRVLAVDLTAPDERPHAPEIVLQGVAAHDDAWSIDYGIEWYFVPEGEGRALETRIGDRAISVLLAVASDGRAAIKALIVDGQSVYVEPLL